MLIDVHVHIISHLTPDGCLLTVDDLLRELDRHRIDKAVVLPLENPEAFSRPTTTWEAIEVCRPHFDRLIPFCIVDPRVNENTPETDFVAYITPYLEAGCKGFGEHKVSLYIDDPRSLSIYRACGELAIPILIHFDDDLNMDEPGLPRFEKVLRQFPQTVFIGHGPAWWANMSGEVDLNVTYPEGKLAPGGAVQRLLGEYDNIYGDLSARSAHNALTRDLEHAREFLHGYSKKLLFGTDLFTRGQELPIVAFLREFGLESDDWENISHANLETLLGP